MVKVSNATILNFAYLSKKKKSTMKVVSQLILGLSILMMLGCEKNNEVLVDDSDMLIGNWSNPVLIDTVWKYERVGSLSENYGFSFKRGQEFLERKNSGWCGTPPITYANYEGSWSRNDSIINISVGYWGGTANFQWRILSINEKQLVIYRMKETYNN